LNLNLNLDVDACMWVSVGAYRALIRLLGDIAVCVLLGRLLTLTLVVAW